MIPKSLSATAVQVAQACLRRFEGEHYNRTAAIGGRAANLGSTVHAALEDFVSDVHVTKSQPNSLDYLLKLFSMHSVANFGTTDYPEYNEGIQMLKDWYNRTDFTDVEVISVEQKSSFDLPTSIGPVTFNYIWDRFDKIGPNSYKVVDYKTNRWGFSPEDLHKKTQARTYALAAAIELKARGIDPDEIWIEFDLLRHGPIGTRFTRDDNIKTWNKLVEIAESIIATPEGDAPPTLNAECLFCKVKATCPLLLSNISGGGIMSLSVEEQVDLRAKLDYQRKAVASTLEEIDELLITRAKEIDEIEFTSETNRMTITVPQRRSVDAEMVERVVGKDLFDLYGGKTLTLKNFQDLMKRPELNMDQKRQLQGLVGVKLGNPTIKIEPRGFVEAD